MPPILSGTYRIAVLVIALMMVLATALLLATGSPLLLRPFFGSSAVPWGTPLTSAGLLSLPVSIYLLHFDGSEKGWERLARDLLLVLGLPAFFWGLVGYGLSGNWFNTFQGGQQFLGISSSRLFWAYTTATAVAPLLWMLVYQLYRLIQRLRSKTLSSR